MNNEKSKIDSQSGGLTFMTLLTMVWTILSGLNYQGRDYYFSFYVFGAIVFYFIFSLFRFNKISKSLPPDVTGESNYKKRFWIIFALEGILIFLAKNILNNTHNDQYFLSVFALIVGLHFIPLAKVFERKFDYYIGVWTTLVAVTGIILTHYTFLSQNLINGIVCTACAMSTSMYGLRMIADGNRIIRENL